MQIVKYIEFGENKAVSNIPIPLYQFVNECARAFDLYDTDLLIEFINASRVPSMHLIPFTTLTRRRIIPNISSRAIVEYFSSIGIYDGEIELDNAEYQTSVRLSWNAVYKCLVVAKESELIHKVSLVYAAYDSYHRQMQMNRAMQLIEDAEARHESIDANRSEVVHPLNAFI